MVVGDEIIAAASVFVVFLGAFVFFLRPGGSLNRALGAMLVLRGASDLMLVSSWRAADAADERMYHAVSHWYESGIPFLTLLLLHYLVPPQGRARWRRWGLGAAVVATLLLSPVATEDRPHASGDPHSEPGPLGVAWVVFLWATRAFAVGVAAYAASSPTLNVLRRRQAGLVGLAMLFPLGRTAFVQVAAVTMGGLEGLRLDPLTLVALPSVAVGLLALPRVAQPFEGTARRLILALACAYLVSGITDTFLAGRPWYRDTHVLMFPTHALCLATAVVRYDMIGMGERARRRVEVFARGMLAAAALLVPAGAALLLLGRNTLGLVVSLAMGTGALAISPTPVRVLAKGFARVFAPDPLDPRLAAERSRIYAAALDRRAGDEELSRLREDLGMRPEDHAALERMLASVDGPARSPPLLGRYLVEREIGRGSFGTVLLARDLATRHNVVLKRFHAGWADRRAQAEAEALARVRHPRVVPLLAVERAGPEVFLVMQYAEGGSAKDLLDASGGPLPAPRALALALDVLEGLEAVHAAGLAHGDVKPANVLVDGRGRGLLGDLGAAQALARPDADLTLTSSPILGSYATLPPEVLRGARRSAAGDVYSTGATLYRLLTGEDYVELSAKDVVRATEAILHHPPRLPHPAVPPEVEPVLRRALSKAPEERYASAAQMREALAQAAARIGSAPPAVEAARA